jgi:hypothetical protein
MSTYKVKNITSGTLIKAGAGHVKAIVINSHTSGTLMVLDGLTTAGTVIFATITLGAAEREIDLHDVDFATGLYVDYGGTINCSVIYN